MGLFEGPDPRCEDPVAGTKPSRGTRPFAFVCSLFGSQKNTEKDASLSEEYARHYNSHAKLEKAPLGHRPEGTKRVVLHWMMELKDIAMSLKLGTQQCIENSTTCRSVKSSPLRNAASLHIGGSTYLGSEPYEH